MGDTTDLLEGCDKEQMVRLLVDMIHRIAVHHGIWFVEVEHQLGMDKALRVLGSAFEKSRDIHMARLAKTLGFEMTGGLPSPLLDLPRDTLCRLIDDTAKNWLATDGVWFQAVEFSSGMFDAKRCNDSCWVRFSPFEARSIKRFLDLPEHAGLAGLKTALSYRLYARINTQSIADEGPGSFVFRMNECRVQSARNRKGLPDYPCKSAGMVEYPCFASEIDSRIATECIACPPDEHPGEWFCAWRFSLAEEGRD